MPETTSITIRNVPSDVHHELAARAARWGQSLEEYVLAELVRLTSRPSMVDLMDTVRARKAAAGTRVSSNDILTAREADGR